MSTIVLVLGWIWYAAAKVNQWDNVEAIVFDKQTGLSSHETRIVVLEKSDEMRREDHRLLLGIAEALGVNKK